MKKISTSFEISLASFVDIPLHLIPIIFSQKERGAPTNSKIYSRYVGSITLKDTQKVSEALSKNTAYRSLSNMDIRDDLISKVEGSRDGRTW